MEISATYSYRHAEAIIAYEYRPERQEILDVIESVSWHPIDPPTVRRRNNRVVATLTINQRRTNDRFDVEFDNRGWIRKPRIVTNSPSQLEADYKKRGVQVEVQFGNMARWYTDVFKFLLSYAADDIEVGVLIVPTRAVSRKIDENVVDCERVIRELPHAKMAITIPVWVIGLGD